MTHETIIDHEVRVRVLEKIAANIDSRFDKLDLKLDSNFKWTVGIFFTIFLSIIIPVILHVAKLI